MAHLKVMIFLERGNGYISEEALYSSPWLTLPSGRLSSLVCSGLSIASLAQVPGRGRRLMLAGNESQSGGALQLLELASCQKTQPLIWGQGKAV